jgi:hypothetical protein
VGEAVRKRSVAAGLLAVVLGGLAGFGFVIQRDYARSWELQRSFWTQVAALCPDLDEGTVILVAPEAFTDTRQIAANHWNLPRVLDQIYSFPADWDDPPRLYRLVSGWEEHIVAGDSRLRLNAQTVLAPPSLYGEVVSTQVIYLSGAGGLLVRETGPLQAAGMELPIKPLPPAAPARHETGPLYRYLIDGSEARSQGGSLRSAAPG